LLQICRATTLHFVILTVTGRKITLCFFPSVKCKVDVLDLPMSV